MLSLKDVGGKVWLWQIGGRPKSLVLCLLLFCCQILRKLVTITVTSKDFCSRLVKREELGESFWLGPARLQAKQGWSLWYWLGMLLTSTSVLYSFQPSSNVESLATWGLLQILGLLMCFLAIRCALNPQMKGRIMEFKFWKRFEVWILVKIGKGRGIWGGPSF